MALTNLQFIFARNFARLVEYIFACGYSCTLGELWRTPEMAEIYAKRKIGIRDSQHCKKLAGDLNLFLNGKLLTDSQAHKPFGEFWESLDPRNRWGGDWDGDNEIDPGDNDGNHYEMRES